METPKKYLSWGDLEVAVERLAANIYNSGHGIAAITGMPRGGLIPAVMLSHKLKIPFTLTPNLADGKILVVDDICDTGKTLEKFKHEENIITVTIHYKQSSSYEPNFWYKLAEEGVWLVYPWENKNSDTIQDYKVK